MGCGGSKSSGETSGSADNRQEAERWQRRKKTGFRDSGLERTRQACVKQKKKLRHVDDPQGAAAAKKKNATAKNKRPGGNNVNPASAGTGGGGGPLGITDSFLQKKRAGLKHR